VANKRLQLPEVLDLTAAAPLAQSLLSRRGAGLTVDASRVRRVGTPCLQVLLAAAATWKAEGVEFRVTKPTEEFLEGGRLLGIGLDEDMNGRGRA
jgi:chemotaxis protein CheX